MTAVQNLCFNSGFMPIMNHLHYVKNLQILYEETVYISALICLVTVQKLAVASVADRFNILGIWSCEGNYGIWSCEGDYTQKWITSLSPCNLRTGCSKPVQYSERMKLAFLCISVFPHLSSLLDYIDMLILVVPYLAFCLHVEVDHWWYNY